MWRKLHWHRLFHWAQEQLLHFNPASLIRASSMSSQQTISRSETPRPSPIQTYSHGLPPRSVSRRNKESGIPDFLQQERTDIRAKWRMLDYLQRERFEQGRSDTTGVGQWRVDLSDVAVSRNRYSNIMPWETTRVRLNVPEECNDYINASHIALIHGNEGPKSYIATQGPKRGQYNHLWRMIWQETDDVAVIVMLTKTLEQGKDKCFQYFPLKAEDSPWHIDGDSEFGDGFRATIKLVEKTKIKKAGCTLRRISLEVGGKVKTVWHLLFKGWPDFGVPDGANKAALLEMIKLANAKNIGPDNPIIVHCSAGVGRSGTWITLDYILRELDRGHIKPDEAGDPVYDTVNLLREQRMYMVQSEAQFHFVYEVLKDFYQLIRRSVSPPADISQGEAS